MTPSEYYQRPANQPVYSERMWRTVTLPLPERMRHEATVAARRLGIPRTQLIRDALEAYLGTD
jgi:hypothetical protein